MFPGRYFPPTYFAPRYFAGSGLTPAVTAGRRSAFLAFLGPGGLVGSVTGVVTIDNRDAIGIGNASRTAAGIAAATRTAAGRANTQTIAGRLPNV